MAGSGIGGIPDSLKLAAETLNIVIASEAGSIGIIIVQKMGKDIRFEE